MLFRLFVCTLCFLLMTQSSFAAQADVGLRIQVMQGSNARNVVEQIPAIPIRVRVTDRSNRPIPGATVVFTSPTSGPSGDFANGLTTFSTITDESGAAEAREFRPNDISGSYQIQVRAEYLGEAATATIRQENVGGKKGKGKLIALVVVAGLAGGAGAALAARGKKSGSSSTPNSPSNPGGSSNTPTITFGGATVGGPK